MSIRNTKLFRTNFLIFPKFQLMLIGTNVGVMLIVSAIIWFQMSKAFSDLNSVSGISGVPSEVFHRYVSHLSASATTSLLVALGIGLAVSVGMTVFISHRFSGPLVNLRGFFRRIAGGETPVPRLKFRRGDYLEDIPPAVNGALDRLEKGVHSASEPSNVVEFPKKGSAKSRSA